MSSGVGGMGGQRESYYGQPAAALHGRGRPEDIPPCMARAAGEKGNGPLKSRGEEEAPSRLSRSSCVFTAFSRQRI